MIRLKSKEIKSTVQAKAKLFGDLKAKVEITGKISNPKSDGRIPPLESDHKIVTIAKDFLDTTRTAPILSVIVESYLLFDGLHYVLTDYIPNQNTKIEADFIRISKTDGSYLLGSENRNGAQGNYSIFFSGDEGHSGRSTNFSFDTLHGGFEEISESERHSLIFSKDGIYLDGSLICSIPEAYSDFVSVCPLCIGGVNSSGWIDTEAMMQGKIYKIKIYEDDNLIMDMIPVQSEYGKSGFLDIVGENFYELTDAPTELPDDLKEE